MSALSGFRIAAFGWDRMARRFLYAITSGGRELPVVPRHYRVIVKRWESAL